MKRYLKYIQNSIKPIVVKNPPIYGKQPTYLRDTDFNINGTWYTNIGDDILDSLDPFEDNSLIAMCNFNNNITDRYKGLNLISVGDYTFDIGMFNRYMYNGYNTNIGSSYLKSINTLHFNKKEVTISGYICQTNVLDTESVVWGLSVNNTPKQYLTLSKSTLISYSLDINNNLQKAVYILKEPITQPTHVVQTFTEYETKLYINSELVKVEYFNTKLNIENSIYTICNQYSINNVKVQQLQIFNRILKDNEIHILYNQQKINIVPCDGLNNNPKPFTYFEDNNKLVVINVDQNGNILSKTTEDKIGYVDDSFNYLTYDKCIVDRYKKPIKGMINRLITKYIDNVLTLLNKATITLELDIDTNLFKYVVQINGVINNSVDIIIKLNGRNVYTATNQSMLSATYIIENSDYNGNSTLDIILDNTDVVKNVAILIYEIIK